MWKSSVLAGSLQPWTVRGPTSGFFHNRTFLMEEVRVSLAIVRPCRVLILSPDGGPGAGGGDRIHTVKGLVSPGSE